MKSFAGSGRFVMRCGWALAFAFWAEAGALHGADVSGEKAAEQNEKDDDLWSRITSSARATFAPCPNDKSIVAAHIEEKTVNWWGYLEVFHHTGNHVDWVAKLPKGYTANCGHYLLSCSWVYLEKLDRYALEVFDSTHRGNGSYWLFALEGQELRVLIHTWGVDSHNEDVDVFPDSKEFARKDGRLDTRGTVILNGRLDPEYKVANDRQEVILTGTIVTMLNQKAVSSREYSETWVWNPKSREFARQPAVKETKR
jgi:hypothetical protein